MANIRTLIPATRISLTARGGHFKGYGERRLFGGHFLLVNGLEASSGVMRRPPEGKQWVRDHNDRYFEVDTQDLKAADFSHNLQDFYDARG